MQYGGHMLPGGVELRKRGDPDFIKRTHRLINDVNDWIRETTDRLCIPLVDLYDVFGEPEDPDMLDGRYSCGDHAHLNIDGYRLMAERLIDGYFSSAEDLSTIVCLGDSHTQGFPGRSDISRNGVRIEIEVDDPNQFPYWLARKLGCTVINRGIAGNTLQGMYRRFDDEVLPHLPDHCVIIGGTNDVLIGNTLDEVKEDLEKLYGVCILNDIVPVTSTIIPLGISPTEG